MILPALFQMFGLTQSQLAPEELFSTALMNLIGISSG